VIEKAAGGCLAWIGATLDPMNGHADGRAAHHRQVESGGAMAHPAAVFAGADIQTEMEAGFNAPIAAVSPEHLLDIELGGGAGTQEKFRLDSLGRFGVAIDAAS
jgi:hypothetical protein